MRVIRAVLFIGHQPAFFIILLYGWTLLSARPISIRSLSVLCSVACSPFYGRIARRTGGDKAIVPACALLRALAARVVFLCRSSDVPLAFALLARDGLEFACLCARENGVFGDIYCIASSAAGLLTHYFFLFPWGAMIAFLLITPGQWKRRNLIGALAIVGLILLPWYL